VGVSYQERPDTDSHGTRHTWFARPIALSDQPYIDQTYRYGSTMGGNFQEHQGVEFNNPDGTPVHAVGDGVVVFAGPAEQGANTIAIRHDRKLKGLFIFSTYYHNAQLLASVGQRIKAGDVIALVGNTGRATNDHLHLEIHAAPVDSVPLIVDPNERYPKYTVNPELWIRPGRESWRGGCGTRRAGPRRKPACTGWSRRSRRKRPTRTPRRTASTITRTRTTASTSPCRMSSPASTRSRWSWAAGG